MRRRYQLQDDDLNDLLTQIINQLGGSPHADLVREILTTGLKLQIEKAHRWDLKIINNALKEMRYAFKVFAPYRHLRKVSLFGSARTKSEHPEYELARRFSALLAKKGWMVITGAGPGIMQAGNEGAGREKAFGANVRIPFEQEANPFIRGDHKLINFKYFFTRKLTFVKEADAYAFFPGGFGTQDELWTLLTLCQTGKNPPVPIVLMDVPKGTYWKRWERFVKGQLTGNGRASPDDTQLFRIFDSEEESVSEIERFYSTYHSLRYVGDMTVLRLRHGLPEKAVETLNREFSDLLEDGQIEAGGPLPEEITEPDLAHLPRLLVPFNETSFARLHVLVDRVNELGAKFAPEPEPGSALR